MVTPQLTPAQDYERKRKFRVPRFVSDYQAVVSSDSFMHGGERIRANGA